MICAFYVYSGIDMPQISRSALVPFSATQMYQLVNDVSASLIFARVVPVAV
jgi:ribosome-associated toxin RatA of RatAB toxin-antitoxin module